jgi:hypothetical protein
MRTELRHVSSRGSVAAAPEPARCRDGLTGSQGTTSRIHGHDDNAPAQRARSVAHALFALIPATTLADGLRLVAEGESQDFGFSVAPAGDVNGDGIPDLIVGAPSYDGIQDFAGRAYLFLGPFDADRSAADADATISAVTFGDNLGFSVAAPAIRTATASTICSSARAATTRGHPVGTGVSLPRTGHRRPAGRRCRRRDLGEDFDELGRAVAGIGDIDDDGIADIALGAPLASNRGACSSSRPRERRAHDRPTPTQSSTARSSTSCSVLRSRARAT